MIKSVLVSVCCVFSSLCLSGRVLAQSSFPGKLAREVLTDTSYPVIARQVTERDVRYIDRDGKIISVHIVQAHLKEHRIALEAATPYDKDGFARQTLTDEMQWESRSPEHLAIAGINADFFDMKNGTPLGVVVKEGRIVKDHFDRTNCFVGVLKSGEVMVGDSLDFKRYEHRLNEALGARPMLLRKGHLLLQDSSSLSKIHHPRSALGIIDGEDILLVTVDGRQPAISNGISLTDLATAMKLLGARDAVNLDGGGSTTLATREQPLSSGALVVKNHPSGKVQRKVANGWILVYSPQSGKISDK